jgi:hypothetical protein
MMTFNMLVNKLGLRRGEVASVYGPPSLQAKTIWSPPVSVREAQRQMREERIQRLAYFLWQAAGEPAGDGVEFWLKAEEEYWSHYSYS